MRFHSVAVIGLSCHRYCKPHARILFFFNVCVMNESQTKCVYLTKLILENILMCVCVCISIYMCVYVLCVCVCNTYIIILIRLCIKWNIISERVQCILYSTASESGNLANVDISTCLTGRCGFSAIRQSESFSGLYSKTIGRWYHYCTQAGVRVGNFGAVSQMNDSNGTSQLFTAIQSTVWSPFYCQRTEAMVKNILNTQI